MRKLGLRLAGVFFASMFHLSFASAQDGSNDLIILLSGASKADRATVEEAAGIGREQGDWKPLENLLNDDDQPVAACAAGLLILNGQSETVVKHIKTRGKHVPMMLLMSGLMPTLSWLDVAVSELSSPEGSDKSRTLALLGLRTISGEKFSEAAQWADWLEEKREIFEQSGVPQPDQLEYLELAKIEFDKRKNADLRSVLEDVQAEQAANETPVDPKAANMLGTIDNLLGQALDAREAGANMERSSDAKAGDGFFRHSEFERAAVAYRRSIEVTPDDDRSRYLLGVALFEARQFDAAATAFSELAARTPEADAAAFMAKVAGNKDIEKKSVLEVAESTLKQERPATDAGAEPNFGSLFTGGWNFGVLQQLAGAAMQENDSINSIDQAPTLATIAECSALQDWRGVLGAAFCLPRDQQASYFVEAARQFENQPEVVAAAIAVTDGGVSSSESESVKQAMIQTLAEIDPSNFVAHLLRITEGIDRNMAKQGLDPAIAKQLRDLTASDLELRTYHSIHQRACENHLQSINHPFRRKSEELPSVLSAGNLMPTVLGLSALRKSEAISDIECADQLVSRLLDSHILGAMASILKLSQAESRKSLKAAYEAAGESEKAEEIIVSDMKSLLSTEVLKISPLLNLCVPSLERAINESKASHEQR